ncbi:hypothetical protein L6452_06269 [Arctium lappa]|uniref:Uncharacterized protein n=1 Tax=Arctium lappa TaxID=4217 RepID=A0ACB9EJC7_ARCLA|nr:hypothetical protein L6452_06269 [Arctium lappa]
MVFVFISNNKNNSILRRDHPQSVMAEPNRATFQKRTLQETMLVTPEKVKQTTSTNTLLHNRTHILEANIITGDVGQISNEVQGSGVQATEEATEEATSNRG